MRTEANLDYVVTAGLIGAVRLCWNEALIFFDDALNDLPVQKDVAAPM